MPDTTELTTAELDEALTAELTKTPKRPAAKKPAAKVIPKPALIPQKEEEPVDELYFGAIEDEDYPESVYVEAKEVIRTWPMTTPNGSRRAEETSHPAASGIHMQLDKPIKSSDPRMIGTQAQKAYLKFPFYSHDCSLVTIHHFNPRDVVKQLYTMAAIGAPIKLTPVPPETLLKMRVAKRKSLKMDGRYVDPTKPFNPERPYDPTAPVDPSTAYTPGVHQVGKQHPPTRPQGFR